MFKRDIRSFGANMTDQAGDDPEEWVRRRPPRAGLPRYVTNGAAAGTSGARFAHVAGSVRLGPDIAARAVNLAQRGA
jgi:hypothetical protein